LLTGPARAPEGRPRTATAAPTPRKRAEVSYNQAGTAPIKRHARPVTDAASVKRRPSTAAIQLPPLSSSRDGPPQQKLVRVPGGAQPRGCGMYPSRGGYRGPVTSTNRRLPAPVYPRKSEKES